MLCWAAGHNEPRSTKPEIGGSGSDVRDTAAACGRSTVAASGGNRRLRQPPGSCLNTCTTARCHSSDQSSPSGDVPGIPHIRIAAACSATTVTGRRNSIKLLLIVLDNVDLLRIGFRIIVNSLF